MNEVSNDEANKIITELESRIDLRREEIRALPPQELDELISQSLNNYYSGLSASRAGAKAAAAKYYLKSIELLSTNIEALDNHAIDLVEELKFADAIPFLEQSALAEPSSPLAFVYLVKCYQEQNRDQLADMTANYLRFHWPDKSPYLDWSHLGIARAPKMLAPPFIEGQVWKYQTKPGNEDSRLWIRLADRYKNGEPIVHVSLTNINYPNFDNDMFVSHLPFTVEALENSGIELTDEEQQFDRDDDFFGDGYRIWNNAHAENKSGAFTISINEVIDTFTEVLGKQQS